MFIFLLSIKKARFCVREVENNNLSIIASPITPIFSLNFVQIHVIRRKNWAYYFLPRPLNVPRGTFAINIVNSFDHFYINLK